MAAFLAQKIEEQGHAISTSMVEAAALLHDVDKALPKSEPLKGLGHADAGAHWLSDNGYGELSGAVAAHPVTRLADNDHYATWARAATVEERVVAYADKRAKSDLVSMDERFDNWIRKHGATEVMRIARERAEILEAERLRRCRDPARGRGTPPLGRSCPADNATQPRVSLPQLAYFWGEDAFSIEHAAQSYARELAQEAGQPVDVWRTTAGGDESARGDL